MSEQGVYVTIDEALNLTGWSREELHRQIGDGTVQVKFGDQPPASTLITKPEDHPAYQCAERVSKECTALLCSPAFQARNRTNTLTADDLKQAQLLINTEYLKRRIIEAVKA